MHIPPEPRFESADFLRSHIRSILDFYEPRVLAKDNGFYQCFFDNGECYEPATRQLVGSARYVFNYATAYRIHGNEHYKQWASHGLAYLNNSHLQANGHYAWLIEHDQITDSRVMAYGHAFVVLAAASCIRAGITSATQTLENTWDFLERFFWEEDAQAYADERDATLATLQPYRGQNANMHMCEAALRAWQATDEPKYLARAATLAKRFTIDLASQQNRMIWEHYDIKWQVDMNFNIDKPNDRYKPWGYQPGHQIEWAKLLLILHEAQPNDKWLERAQELFDDGIRTGWDTEFGGIVYSVDPAGNYCAAEKYFWVHAEAISTAWLLYKATGEVKYFQQYQRIWQWAWKHLIDHEYGAWFRIRNRNGTAIDNLKSPPGKTDYHTMGACWDVLESFE